MFLRQVMTSLIQVWGLKTMEMVHRMIKHYGCWGNTYYHSLFLLNNYFSNCCNPPTAKIHLAQMSFLGSVFPPLPSAFWLPWPHLLHLSLSCTDHPVTLQTNDPTQRLWGKKASCCYRYSFHLLLFKTSRLCSLSE